MILIYKNLYDDDGNEVPGRKILFVAAEYDGTITSSTSSHSLAVNQTGFVYIVDDTVLNNIDKFEVINGNLQLRKGETLEKVVKSEKELQREALLKQLAELDSQPAE